MADGGLSSISDSAVSSDSGGTGQSAAGFGSGLVGGILDAVIGPVMANAQKGWSSRAARHARQWSEYMAGTQYQRTTKDLIAAGLNPLLAVKGMSPMNTGNIMMDTPRMPASDISGAMSRGVSSAVQLKTLNANARLIEENARAAKNLADASEVSKSKAWAEVSELLARAGMHDMAMQTGAKSLGLTEEQTRRARAETRLTTARTAEEEASAKFWRSDMGDEMKAIMPIVQLLRSILR